MNIEMIETAANLWWIFPALYVGAFAWVLTRKGDK